MIFDISYVAAINKYVVVFVLSDRYPCKGVYLITYGKGGWVLDPKLLAVRRLDVYGPYCKGDDKVISVVFGKTPGDAY